MLKILCLLVASALLIEATPIDSELAEAAKNGNWDVFNSLLRQFTQNAWVPPLAANVEDLKPSDGTHVYGHSVSAFKQWENVNGKVSETGRGEEVINNDALKVGQVFDLLQQSEFEDYEDDPFGADDTEDEYLLRSTRASDSDSSTSSESELASPTPVLQHGRVF